MADEAVALSAVALPAGVAPTGQLRVNVYLSPRLSGAATLAGFPDWLDWPDLIRSHGLSVSLQCGGSTATVPAGTGAAAAGHLAGDLHAGGDRQPRIPGRSLQPAAARVVPGAGRARLPQVHLPAGRGDRADRRRRGAVPDCSSS